MRTIFLCILLVFTISAAGQVEEEVRYYQDSTVHFINNGRILFLEALKDNKLNKAKEIRTYLKDLTEYKPYSGFSYEEELMIFLIFDSLEGWTNNAGNYEAFQGGRPYMPHFYNYRSYGESYPIYPVLSKLLKEDLAEVEKSIENSDLTAEERDLLELFLLHINTVGMSEEYIALYEAFKKNYQNSPYGDFFDYFLPKPELRASIGISGGASVSIPSSKLAESFNQNVGGFFSIDFGVRRAYGSLYADFGSWELKNEFQGRLNNELTTFSEGEYFSFFKGGLHLGYSVLRLKHLHIAPYANIAGGNLQSNRLKPEDSSAEFKVFNSFIYGLGLHCQIKLFEYKTNSFTYSTSSGHGHLSLKIQAGYDRIALSRNEQFEGDLTTLRVGIVWGWENY